MPGATCEIGLDRPTTFCYYALKHLMKHPEKLARKIERWHKILAPQFPDIDPHDLDLIIAALLRSRKERMQIMFLKRRKDGRYVF